VYNTCQYVVGLDLTYLTYLFTIRVDWSVSSLGLATGTVVYFQEAVHHNYCQPDRHFICNFYIISRAVYKVVIIIWVETKLTVAVVFYLWIGRFQIRMTEFGISIETLIIRTIIMREIRTRETCEIFVFCRLDQLNLFDPGFYSILPKQNAKLLRWKSVNENKVYFPLVSVMWWHLNIKICIHLTTVNACSSE
jgi:hypothetical protein